MRQLCSSDMWGSQVSQNYFTKNIAGVDEGLEEYTRSMDAPHFGFEPCRRWSSLTEDPLDGRRARRTV